jgi:type I restriction enzyme S subunit
MATGVLTWNGCGTLSSKTSHPWYPCCKRCWRLKLTLSDAGYGTDGVSANNGNRLPPGWAICRLGDGVDIVRGISFPKDAKAFIPQEGYIACLRTTNVQREAEWDDLWFVPAKYVKTEVRNVRLYDILISTANSLELVGKVAHVRILPCPSTLGAFISLLRSSTQLDPRFVYFQLASQEVQAEIRRSASTTTNISNVSTRRLVEIPLKIAPLSEQHRIVAEIEKQFTRLDASVSALKRAQANLKRCRASVLKAACEGLGLPLLAREKTYNLPSPLAERGWG